MIRLLESKDIDTICNIVNDNWKTVYSGYINNELITNEGCNKRRERMIKDFASKRLLNYVYEDNGQAVALLSIGDTADEDKKGSFELWRIYIAKPYQHKGLGNELLHFAEKKAVQNNYKEIVIWAFKNNLNAISFYKKHGYAMDKEELLGEPYLTYATRLTKTVF